MKLWITSIQQFWHLVFTVSMIMKCNCKNNEVSPYICRWSYIKYDPYCRDSQFIPFAFGGKGCNAMCSNDLGKSNLWILTGFLTSHCSESPYQKNKNRWKLTKTYTSRVCKFRDCWANMQLRSSNLEEVSVSKILVLTLELQHVT